MTDKKQKIIGYVRMSTTKQDGEGQKHAIREAAEKHSWIIDEWFIEQSSAWSKTFANRELPKLLARMNKDDILIITEVSRLARIFIDSLRILFYFFDKEIKVYHTGKQEFLSYDYHTFAKWMAEGQGAEEDSLHRSRRTKEALAARKAKGVILGRPVGRKNNEKTRKLYPFKQDIIYYLRANTSRECIARLCSNRLDDTCEVRTVNKYIKDYGLVELAKQGEVDEDN